MRLRLTIEYDGTPFHGWAAQPGLPTVEGALREALGSTFASFDKLAVAGRTDAGVHALGQVASVDVTGGPAIERAAEALNTRLPDEISVLAAEAAEPDFHARHSARFAELPLPDPQPALAVAVRDAAELVDPARARRRAAGGRGSAAPRQARLPCVHADGDAARGVRPHRRAAPSGFATATTSTSRSPRTATCATWCGASSGRCSSSGRTRSRRCSPVAPAPTRARRRRRGGSTSSASGTDPRGRLVSRLAPRRRWRRQGRRGCRGSRTQPTGRRS